MPEPGAYKYPADLTTKSQDELKEDSKTVFIKRPINQLTEKSINRDLDLVIED